MKLTERTLDNPACSGLQQAARLLKTASNVLITTHINPDGDAIGSALGLAHILKAMGKKVTVATQDGAGIRYRFLPGAGEIINSVSDVFELGIAVDCGGIGRVGNIQPALEKSGKVLRIDHHSVGEPFGDVEYLDPTAAAVGEMIATLADYLEVEIPKEAGICLLASIIEDTGCFQFDSVGSHTFRICAELVEAGADLHGVVKQLYWTVSPGAQVMIADCIRRMKLEADGALAWTVAGIADLERLGITHEDVDGVAQSLLTTAGVEVAILFREEESVYRVSLRSRDYVDVGELAREFGGGGHNKAAGCRMRKDENRIRELLDAAAVKIKSNQEFC